MAYEPFRRGPFPVGVRSGLAVDRTRDDRQLPFEVWYPAGPECAGMDLSTATQDAFAVQPGGEPVHQAAVRDAGIRAGRYPVVLYSHASYGHRRQSSFLCTHLASHGYVVAAVDHTGNGAVDFAVRAKRLADGAVPTQQEADAYLQRIIADRVPDLRFLLDQIMTSAPAKISEQIDEGRVGLIGWSFGGWAALATLEADDRFGALVALAPAGNSKPLPGIIPATLTFAWKREVGTLFLVAERDRFTPLAGQYELFDRAPSSKRMFVLRHADHQHFADQIDDPGLCPREAAHVFTRGLSLAQLDTVLKEDEAAKRFMESDPVERLRERGVETVAHVSSA